MTIYRLTMVTYYVDATTTPGTPRLTRMINHFPPQALAGVVEDLDITYDLVDGVDQSGERPVAALYADGLTYTANQIRKVNLHIGVRSEICRAGRRTTTSGTTCRRRSASATWRACRPVPRGTDAMEPVYLAHANERGIALITTLLVMMLMSALLVGFTAVVMSDQRYRFIDRDRSQAFYAAAAGLEKLTADLGNLFFTNVAPNAAQVHALTTNTADASRTSSTSRPTAATGYTITSQHLGPHDDLDRAVPGAERAHDAVHDGRRRRARRRRRSAPAAHHRDRWRFRCSSSASSPTWT